MTREIRELLTRWRSIHRPSCICHACEDTDRLLAAASEPAEGEREAALLEAAEYFTRKRSLANRECLWMLDQVIAHLRELATAAPRPPSSPDPSELCGACGHHRHEPGQCWYQARSLDPICRCAGPAPSPDRAPTCDWCHGPYVRADDGVWTCPQCKRPMRCMHSTCGVICTAPASSPDPGAREERMRRAVEEQTRTLLAAPSPAAAARCTTCGLPMSDPNHAGSPPGCPGPAAAEAPRRCVCGDLEEEHAPSPLERITSPLVNLDPGCRRPGCGCERFRPRAPRPPQTKEGTDDR